MFYERYNFQRDDKQVCQDCKRDGRKGYYCCRLGDEKVYLCPPCSKIRAEAWETARPQAPFPHQLYCRKSAKNIFNPYSWFEGRRVNWTGKEHPFVGLSCRPDKLIKLSGREHWIWVADWRAEELEIGPYKKN